MKAWQKLASAAATAAMLIGAVAIGGGTPLSPARVANATRDAADNSDQAVRNTSAAARDTAALATIARNVGVQLDTSRRLLATQLDIEQSSRSGAETSALVGRKVVAIRRALEHLEERFGVLAGLASRTTGTARTSEAAARRLDAVLDVLKRRYRVVVKESRELNRKARGYEKARP